MATRLPPEWAPHALTWIGFPSDPAEWPRGLAAPQRQAAAFAEALHARGAGERVVLVASGADAAARARALAPPGVEVAERRFGDIWLRDTGPIVVRGADGPIALDFGFNGWGGKYEMPGDEDIGARLAAGAGLSVARQDWIFEGGAIDVDGAGLGVTTEQCLLNPNRNPHLTRTEIEARLRDALGIERLLWLGEGLAGDHTDGHVDNLARFVGPGRLAVPVPTSDDPNEAVYRDARARAEAFGLDVFPMPSPGRVEREGQLLAASYMNFAIGNAAVVLPVYGVPNDGIAIAGLRDAFPDREVVGVRADDILLSGGGSFHCMSQQVPA